jgi:hypothetical protein
MALLATKTHTVGNRARWTVDYSDWLQDGAVLFTAAIVSSSITATVDTTSFNPTKTEVMFFVNGGLLNEVFTVTLTVSDTLSQIRVDTVTFTVVAP